MKKLLIILPLLTACDDHPKTVIVQPSNPMVQQYPVSQNAPQPVIINQESSSSVGSFAAGAALGALAGHVGTNLMNDKNSQTPTISDRREISSNIKQSSAMDMNKLSASSSKPSVNLSKEPSRNSRMNMSKLSNYGKR